MCQLLYANFQWIDDVHNFDFTTIVLDSTGYILEVNLEYPQHLHNEHIDFYPTREKPSDKCEDKLLTLYDKQRYIIHYLQ